MSELKKIMWHLLMWHLLETGKLRLKETSGRFVDFPISKYIN